ncbi:MAG: hypothetical protein JO166_06900 [Deltaproteobacteria bacterium]|nr:hypothetical protein [Deltaproteobacteria bacterium]
MNSLQLKAFTPHIRRGQGPIIFGLYANPGNPQRVKLPAVLKLMNKACELMPWIRGEYLSTLRKWCEMELIRRAVFNALSQLSPDLGRKLLGILCVDSKSHDATLVRSVDDYRKLTMSQLELLMTPALRAQLDGKQADELDSIAMMMLAQTEDPLPRIHHTISHHWKTRHRTKSRRPTRANQKIIDRLLNPVGIPDSVQITVGPAIDGAARISGAHLAHHVMDDLSQVRRHLRDRRWNAKPTARKVENVINHTVGGGYCSVSSSQF